jgi:putative sterol carrier protein
MQRFATFRPLTQRLRSEIGETLRGMSASLRQTRERGRIHFRILDATGRTDWTLELGKASKVVERAVGKPKLEVVTRADTWHLIAAGELSPLEAFITGKLRLRGDVEMAKRIVRHLAISEGEIDICR